MFVSVVVDVDNTITDLNTMKNSIDGVVQTTLQRLIIELTNYIKSNKLSGGVLKVQTGRLRNSIHYKLGNNGSSSYAEAYTNVKYAGVHEFGFNGSVAVKSHLREIKQVFGKPVSPRSINISGFQRRMRMPERSFMRSALADYKNKIYSDFEAAVDRIII